MVSCPSCGADLKFDPKSQMLICPHCRNKYNPEDVKDLKLDEAKEVEKVENVENAENGIKVISYKCSHCGAELFTTDETMTTFCSFCRSGTILDRKVLKKRVPDYIIPFSISKEECKEIYINRIKKSFFAPKRMIDSEEVEKIRAIYMPYWLYAFKYEGPNTAKGSSYAYSSGDYRYYNDYEITTNLEAKFKGLTHDASSDFTDRMSEAIEPFNIKDLKKFSPSYLSGFYADNENVHSKVYIEEYNKIANDIVSEKLGEEDAYRNHNITPIVNLDEKSVKLALFPVYFLATKSRSGNNLNYAVINGQTGKMTADIPIDPRKIFGFSTILAVILFFILNFFVTLTMSSLIICSIIFNLISLFIISNQNNKIKDKEENITDKGKLYKINKNAGGSNKKREKSPLAFIKTLFWLLIAAIIFIVFWIIGIMYNLKIIKIITNTILVAAINIKYILILLILILVFVKIIKNPKYGKNIVFPALGLIISLLVLVIEPALDEYYYFSAAISIVISIICFLNIVWKHNVLTSQKLSLLGKRGGDENA